MVIGIDASRANQREKTGTEWYAWHLIRHLLPLLTAHQVRLYVREPLQTDWGQLPSGVEVKVLNWAPGILWSHLRLGWELLWHPPTVLFVPADTVPLVRRSPTYTTIHDVAFERLPELYSHRSVQRRLGWARPLVHSLVRLLTLGRYSASELDYHRWSVRHAIRISRGILTVSEFTKHELVELLEAESRLITVTYQGVKQPEDFTQISHEEKKIQLKEFALARPFYLYVGRLERKKNIQALLEGYRVYCRLTENPNDLVLIGSPGYGWTEARPLLDTPELRGRVHQLGWVEEDKLNILRASARAFVFLSAYEGFGVPPLESVSAGVPVLASRNGSIPEILGAAGLYVDPEDPLAVGAALNKLGTDEELCRRLVQSGQQQVRKFTWQESARRTAQVLLSGLPKQL